MKDYSKIASEYAKDVISGKRIACKWVILACKRHIEDLESQRNAEFPYYFSEEKASRVCFFIENQYHTKGKWAQKRERLILEPWQVFFVASVFGWLQKKNDLRKYVEVLLLVPRKNGKSALAAAIGLYMLCADGEYGAEVYSGATSEKQAYEVFRPAKLMASMNDDMRDHFGIQVNASNLCTPDNGGRFEPVIAKPGDGSSPSCAIADEVHEHKTSELIDTMVTGMGARDQPIMLYITTAGDNISGPCYQMQLDCQKALEGSIENDKFFGLIYTVDPGDDWTKLETLKKANPNFGVSVSGDFLEARLQDAKNNSRKQSTFQTKHLNIWVGSRDAYFNVQRWRECANESLKLEDFAGYPVYIGMDLASKVDIAALEILIPQGDGDYVRFGKYYLPEETVMSGDNEHYQGWMRDGWLTVTDGEIIDYRAIADDIESLCKMFEVQELAYDPFQATMLVTELMDKGVPVVEMRPTVLNFSEPMKTLDSVIRARQIQHNGDPVMTWMISNVVAKEDAKDNVFPRKERPESKIDGAIALMMAFGRCMNHENTDISAAIDDFIAVKL